MSPVHVVIAVLRSAARLAAGPQGAHRDATLVGLGDEPHAARVGRPIRLRCADLDEGARGGLDGDRAAHVADPQPLLWGHLGPLGPGGTRVSRARVWSAVELLA